MRKRTLFILLVSVSFFAACSVSKYDPDKKYSPQQLRQDYSLLRAILEKKHPSLYWYTAKDSMDHYMDSSYAAITDSMTDYAFGWQFLAPLTHQVHCGHTSFEMSRHKDHVKRSASFFPLQVKVWGDTMIVMSNYNKNDSVIKEGAVITSVNGISNHELFTRMLEYLPLDGNSDNVNYVRLSSNFPFYHRAIFGSSAAYKIGYIDSTGQVQTAMVPAIVLDNGAGKQVKNILKLSKKELKKKRTDFARTLEIDTSINTAVITLNTFTNGDGAKLRAFFRNSFKIIRKDSIQNCILDLRFNGGGDINMYVLLTKYLRNTPFKVSDSSYAIAGSLKPYSKYISQSFFDDLGLFFLTKKRKDGNYHFWYWENKIFNPKLKNHFGGHLYVLINGPTFSAATLFCNAVKGQSNVTLVGEEAGGGAYGNNGIMIPDIVLPNTKLRVRLPMFRMVQYDHGAKDGKGVEPDIYIAPTTDGVRKKIDRKMLIVKQMIRNAKR